MWLVRRKVMVWALLIGWLARLGGLPASPYYPALPAYLFQLPNLLLCRQNTAYKYMVILEHYSHYHNKHTNNFSTNLHHLYKPNLHPWHLSSKRQSFTTLRLIFTSTKAHYNI